MAALSDLGLKTGSKTGSFELLRIPTRSKYTTWSAIEQAARRKADKMSRISDQRVVVATQQDTRRYNGTFIVVTDKKLWAGLTTGNVKSSLNLSTRNLICKFNLSTSTNQIDPLVVLLGDHVAR
jgi:hypothetical protein